MRTKIILLIVFPGISLLLFFLMLSNQPALPEEPPAAPPVPEVQIVKVQATAFCEYGHDANGIDYGPGYCIISTRGEIPLYLLLAVDIYGEAQAVAVSDQMSPNEIKIWYNAPSKIPMFGEQTAYVRVLGAGDKPHKDY